MPTGPVGGGWRVEGGGWRRGGGENEHIHVISNDERDHAWGNKLDSSIVSTGVHEMYNN